MIKKRFIGDGIIQSLVKDSETANNSGRIRDSLGTIISKDLKDSFIQVTN